MAALTKDRNTPYIDGDLMEQPVAASVVIHAGALAVANASGYVAPGSTATTLTALGRAEEAVDNTGGSNGDVKARIRRGRAFRFANDGVDPVTQASLGKDCYIVDDQTVAATDGTGSRSVAGKVHGVDSEGVWVYIG